MKFLLDGSLGIRFITWRPPSAGRDSAAVKGFKEWIGQHGLPRSSIPGPLTAFFLAGPLVVDAPLQDNQHARENYYHKPSRYPPSDDPIRVVTPCCDQADVTQTCTSSTPESVVNGHEDKLYLSSSRLVHHPVDNKVRFCLSSGQLGRHFVSHRADRALNYTFDDP